MARHRFYRRVFEGAPLFGAGLSTAVTVFDSDTDLKVTVYDAETGGSPLANPFFLTEIGKFDFWAEEGNYRVTAVSGSNTDSWEGRIGPYPGGGGGAASFDDLDDVPAYSGNAGRSLKVNGDENALVIGEPDITAGTAAASYSLTLGIWNEVKTITGSGSVAITIPLDATLDLPIGYVHVIRPNDAFSGTATWTPESGSVTVESPTGGTLIAPAGGTSAALKIAANSWVVFGQVEAA